jgi:DNA-nicking Smr family endonuclease
MVMSARDASRRRLLSPEERVLWSTFTKTIEPLRTGVPMEPGDIASPPVLSQATLLTSRPVTPRPPAPVPPSPPAPLAPLGRRMRARVARGKEAIDARLDLHGLTQSEAHAALARFLRQASTRGARLVLVITGKGRRGDAEGGVLRRQVPQWLGLADFRSFVIGFEDAHVAHGGEGALYVRLRKTRNG